MGRGRSREQSRPRSDPTRHIASLQLVSLSRRPPPQHDHPDSPAAPQPHPGASSASQYFLSCDGMVPHALLLLLLANAQFHASSCSEAPGAAPPVVPPVVPPDSLSALLTTRSQRPARPARPSRPARPVPIPAFADSGQQQPKADAFINEVTELLSGSGGSGVSPKLGRSPGGKIPAAGAAGGLNVVITPPLFQAEDSWPGSCRLRSKRYVSDGLCMSPRPLTEVVCADTCVMNAWTKGEARPLPWRCADAGWRRKRVKLLCRDGSTRAYRIRVVQSCRCVPRQERQEQVHRWGEGKGKGKG